MILEYERIYQSMTCDGTLKKQMEDVEAALAMAAKKKSKLLELAAADKITLDDFAEMTKSCNAEIRQLEMELSELRAQEEDSEDYRKNMEQIRRVLQRAQQICNTDAITPEFVDTFIDRILVTPTAENTLRLDIKIFTGDSCERYFEKLKRRASVDGRAGDIFLTI